MTWNELINLIDEHQFGESDVKCVPNVRDYGSEIIIYYRFRGWWLNIQWITSNLMGLTKNEIEHIKGMAQCKYNMYYAKSVVSNI